MWGAKYTPRGRGPPARLEAGDQVALAEPPAQGEPVAAEDGTVRDGSTGAHRVVLGAGGSVADHLLGRAELADQDAEDPVRFRRGRLGVQRRVVLAVVTHEQPAQLRQLLEQAPQLFPLVLLPGPEPPRLRGPPVGQQERAGRIAVGMPAFADGLRAAHITDAVLASAREERWIDVAPVEVTT